MNPDYANNLLTIFQLKKLIKNYKINNSTVKRINIRYLEIKSFT